MALRTLSGILLPAPGHRGAGTALIRFHPYAVEGDVEPASPDDVAEVGPSAPFATRPAKMVALRQVTLKHTDRDSIFGGEGRSYLESWSLDDWFDPSGTESLTVRWEGGYASEIHEIAFMIVGETDGDADTA